MIIAAQNCPVWFGEDVRGVADSVTDEERAADAAAPAHRHIVRSLDLGVTWECLLCGAPVVAARFTGARWPAWAASQRPEPTFRWTTVSGEVTVDDSFAHGVWTAVAATLAEPLRITMDEHYDDCQRCQTHGIANCPVGYGLFLLLPAGDRVVIA